MKTNKRFAAAAGAVVVAASVVPFAVSANSSANIKSSFNKPAFGRQVRTNAKKYAPGISGKVSAVNGNAVTVAAKTGIFTVDISDAKLSGPKNTPLALSGIKIGDVVLVIGQISGTSVKAEVVRDLGMFDELKLRPAKTNAYTGKVTAISGTMLTFVDAKGVTYKADAGFSGVKLVRRFGTEMKPGDFQINDQIAVTGTLGVDGMTLVPTMIRNLSLQAHEGTFIGTISSVSGSSFVISSKNRGNQTITTDATTKFKQLGKASVSIADIVAGQTVIVSGAWDRNNSNVAAKNVTVKVETVRVTGKVTAVAGSLITVAGTDNKIYSIDASKSKVIYRGGRKAGVSIVAVGDNVMAFGTAVSGSSTFAAQSIRDLSKTYVKSAKSS